MECQSITCLYSALNQMQEYELRLQQNVQKPLIVINNNIEQYHRSHSETKTDIFSTETPNS